jgi:hypothetical protein
MFGEGIEAPALGGLRGAWLEGARWLPTVIDATVPISPPWMVAKTVSAVWIAAGTVGSGPKYASARKPWMGGLSRSCRGFLRCRYRSLGAARCDIAFGCRVVDLWRAIGDQAPDAARRAAVLVGCRAVGE